MTFSHYFETTDGREIPFTVRAEFSKDGIGAYEFQGHKGFDGGRATVEVYLENVEWERDRKETENWVAANGDILREIALDWYYLTDDEDYD